jgi:hypothetical protein
MKAEPGEDGFGFFVLLGWGGVQTAETWAIGGDRLARMQLDDALNQLAGDAQTPRDKLLAALEMYDDGVALQRMTFRRQFPELTEQELQRKLDRWLAREDEAH